MLLALTDIRSNAAGEHTSLSQMRAVLRELRRSFNALKRSLGSAKREMAWNFARTPDHSALRARLERQFEADRAATKAKLRETEALLASWSAPLKTRKQRATHPQPEFPF
jgi:septal ring factor EnvC (AmiA/AmiB activator)